jgi:uncharacterized protein YegP (UPF0339 family)
MPREDDVVRLYKDTKGKWRWRRRALNGEIIAISGEGDGYEHYSDAKRMATELNPDCEIAVTTERENYGS